MTTRLLALAVAVALSASCGGTTGGAHVTFPAFAAGPADASGGPLEFRNVVSDTPGYHIVLTRAQLHIGAVYLKPTTQISGAQATACYFAQPGFYTVEVLNSLDVDALSPAPQPFPAEGFATSIPVHSGELWLTGGDINTIDDSTPILNVAGTADQAGVSYPFAGRLTIGRNRLQTSRDPGFPSLHPICKERIVTPIPVDVTPQPGGSLTVRIDPRGWFDQVDFKKLTASGSPPRYQFVDAPGADTASDALYSGLKSVIGVYQFTWQ
jgi:hypothetical protein